MAGLCHTGQRRHSTFLSSQKVLLNGVEGTLDVRVRILSDFGK